MRGTVAIAAAVVALAGCGLATSGLAGDAPPGDAGSLDASVDPGTDATIPDASAAETAPLQSDGPSPAEDANPPDDDAPEGADVATIDAGADACSETGDAGALATVSAWPMPPAKAPKIDGDLSDWPCDGVIAFSGANAAYVKDGAHPIAANVQVRWDKQNVYVGVRVTDANVGMPGYDPVNPYNNDSVEVYVSGDSGLNGDYDSITHQYVTDYKGLIVDYGPTHSGAAADTSPAHFSAAAKTATGGWVFEAAVGWQAVLASGSSYTPGMNLALDFEVNDGDGTSQIAALVLTLAPALATCSCVQAQCCCGQVTGDLPSCDSSRIGRVTLQ